MHALLRIVDDYIYCVRNDREGWAKVPVEGFGAGRRPVSLAAVTESGALIAPARRPLTDPIDRQIAATLVADGRSTLKALADVTGLSVSAVQARLRRLEADGIIRGYTALLDAEAIGLPLAALIAITPLDPAEPDNAPERLARLTEIEACHSVAGDDSYVLLVRVASPTALEQLIREIRKRANVSTRTTVVLQTFFERRAMPPTG
jgi:Lrp/AsnC family leucine-responsive transcriptional regulator